MAVIGKKILHCHDIGSSRNVADNTVIYNSKYKYTAYPMYIYQQS